MTHGIAKHGVFGDRSTEPLPPEIEVEGIQGAGPQIFIGGLAPPNHDHGDNPLPSPPPAPHTQCWHPSTALSFAGGFAWSVHVRVDIIAKHHESAETDPRRCKARDTPSAARRGVRCNNSSLYAICV